MTRGPYFGACLPDARSIAGPIRMDLRKILEQVRVPPGSKVKLSHFDPAWPGTAEMKHLCGDKLKARAKRMIEQNVHELANAQELLWASDTYAMLVVFQAMDAAGKDGTIKHVMSGVNPQGCEVVSFKAPTVEELDHTFLWRAAKASPSRGKITIFNRSHYEDVLIVNVHPELLEQSKLPPGKRGKSFWRARYDDINSFEQHLHRNGTRIVKFFLNLSKDEQKRRFLSRLDDKRKHWKFSMADVRERGYWDKYQAAYQDMLRATSTHWAPWYVIPADNKWVARAMVSAILTHVINTLELRWPEVNDEHRKELAEARKRLLSE